MLLNRPYLSWYSVFLSPEQDMQSKRPRTGQILRQVTVLYCFIGFMGNSFFLLKFSSSNIL
jgi:hypothetical protein